MASGISGRFPLDSWRLKNVGQCPLDSWKRVNSCQNWGLNQTSPTVRRTSLPWRSHGDPQHAVGEEWRPIKALKRQGNFPRPSN
ncbi:hypothetical protein FKM82_023491 [Ascaphus truei]